MMLSIGLENGETKTYQTWYEKSVHESSNTYHTKCSMRWDREPRLEDGCDHIECAVKAHDSLLGFLSYSILAASVFIISFYGLIGSYSFMEKGGVEGLILSMVACLIVISMPVGIWTHYKKYLKHRELVEFRDHATINGIKAHISSPS